MNIRNFIKIIFSKYNHIDHYIMINTNISTKEGTITNTIKISSPFTDQKPGTSGLRKSSTQFETEHYLEIFIESILRTLPGVKGGTLVVGGDGRYGNQRAINLILRMGAAHGLAKVITTTKGILSTPAASNLIRKEQAIGGIILSASHNPGGPSGDFGIKVNGPNGGPASESLTNEIYKCSKELMEYRLSENIKISISEQKNFQIGETQIKVIDGVEDYIRMMEKIFDLNQIKDLMNDNFPIVFDAMHAVTGPYAKKLFEEILEAPKGTVRNSIALEDFGGGHPDPNLTYAHELADLLLTKQDYCFGAACDGDGDRNMIIGKNCFVNPSDSLAVITANMNLIPGYADGINGVARSMPTSSAVDIVAKDLGIKCYETPTGWKFFGNLLDANKITICGEESFGTGSNHVREKDGLWAVLCWLQILASKRTSVADIMKNHWSKYGRHYYSRHDYEAIESNSAHDLYDRLEKLLPSLIGTQFGYSKICNTDNFKYIDPIDNSITTNQGLRILLEDRSRVMVRLSGTGTKGSTLRIYLEKYTPSNKDLNQNPQDALRALIKDINNVCEIQKRTGMSHPTVIT